MSATATWPVVFPAADKVTEPAPVYCAWCRKHLSGPEVGYLDARVSHGICPSCKGSMLKKEVK